MTAPGRHLEALSGLSGGVAELVDAIQGVLLHADWASVHGLEGPLARHTLPVADRLDDILRRDPAPLGTRRPPARRSTGSCRDFALMLCAALRCKVVPARVRCGFAAYFNAAWEDHWVCEYWDGATGTWRLADAQIDAMLRQRQAMNFAATDVPRSMFMTAGEAWLACRVAADPASFGHGDTTGLWFVGVNVVRDHLALNGRETSDWDRWREAPVERRMVRQDDVTWLDDLARSPFQRPGGPGPGWLVSGGRL